ncbi:iron ABC transporter substrate-binding protein [Actinotalea ferrariae CF5-4]|uniref:Iron ABC transporter substrate-binding protein n=1 Tax=Actinotalea ferrariae CF5-4 TaxID=948458 RepID=A0A021VQK7_9CELL|nr:extracellular solute-binding protein [Actinotalea ferrariae]EYR62340.1 iron ABC transporter substrate-binding protein [Actinotalea ferrariae CF5-4]
MRRSRLALPTALLAVTATLAACGSDAGSPDGVGDDAEGALVIYSGRNENLVEPVLDRLEEAVGVPVEVRYAGTSELAAQLLEEGEATDADVFFGQDAGALGALAGAGMLTELDPEVLDLVAEDFRDADGRWVATSGRARVVAYDPEQVPQVESITGVDQLLDPQWAGKIGFAPSNASFHAFVTALRVDRGEDGAREWLEAFAANDPQVYENNVAVLDAVESGEVALGLINHYYWYQRTAELGEDGVDARIHFLAPDDPGALINVAGAGIVAGTDQPEAAAEAIAFLLSEEAQQYFADETAEYPVVAGVESTVFDLPPLSELQGQQIDLNDLESLAETLALLDEVGLT